MGDRIGETPLKIIFSYLSGKDLSSVAEVCSTWLRIAEDEKNKRGPICKIKIQGDKQFSKSWENDKLEILKVYPVKPAFVIYFTTDGDRLNKRDPCFCTFWPISCLAIILINYYPIKKNYTTTSMFFPEVFNIKFTKYTFFMKSWYNKIHCMELNSSFGYGFIPDILKSSWTTFFRKQKLTKHCMFLFCTINSLPMVKYLLKEMADRFSSSKIFVWGGVVNDIDTCCEAHKALECDFSINCTFSFITGRNMKIWSTVLDKSCDTKEKIENKLKYFSKSIKLKQYSIGFMYTSSTRLETLYDIESEVFKEIFPKTTLYHIFGFSAIGGESIKEVWNDFSKLNLLGVYKSDSRRWHTTILMLTYAKNLNI